MNLEIKAVHFTLKDDSKEYLKKKLAKIHNAETHIVDLLVTVNKDAKDYEAEATINFRWGVASHVKERDVELSAAIDRLVDALVAKINKEKEKYQEKRG
jgi:putative sigma-54 modulation protein